MENITQLLRSEIESELKKLKDLAIGSKEYQTTVEGITKLTDRLIEHEKLVNDQTEKSKNREVTAAQAEFDKQFKEEQFEFDKQIKEKQIEFDKQIKEKQIEDTRAVALFDQEFKEKQLKEEQKDRLIRNSIAAAGIVIPSVITIWGTIKSLQFEKEGTVTTIMGRGFINKLLPKK